MKPALFAKLAAVPMMCVAVVCTGVATLGQTAPPKTTSKTKTAKALLDLNTASAEELQELRGVGPVTAKRIIAGRPYTKVDDLTKARVPARVIESIRNQVRVGSTTAAKPMPKGKSAPPADEAAEKVNLNTADEAALESLPGIGPAHAKAIIAGRPYRAVDDLDRVKGLGKSRIDALRSHVTTSALQAPAKGKAAMTRRTGKASSTATKATAKLQPGQKVDLNTATKEELDALPGIGPVKAQAIIDNRPFKTIEDVMKVKGIKEGEFAKIKDMISVK
jgi:competence protein ComEA